MNKYTFLPPAVGCLWMLGSLVPYLVTGEMWGMVWVYLNAPLSFWLKETWLTEQLYPMLWVAVTTTANAVLLAMLVGFCLSLLASGGKKR
ncbi:hypothetical protein [Brevifollis gellanilyticus]|uniref:hypothetical protein n=1 Tax=Brevifollis gellanilyticus TaxID=748831 RepID=UPI0011BFA9FD|nr:hypothetical protein [Brevifollis gellanilyticus]